MTVSSESASLKRRYHRNTNEPWTAEEWKGLTVAESQSFLASLIYAIDNPWLYANDRLAEPQSPHAIGHIRGRPKEWTDYYPCVTWTGVTDSKGRVIINDDVWAWYTTDFEKCKVPRLDSAIGVAFRAFRDLFPDPTWKPELSRWTSTGTNVEARAVYPPPAERNGSVR